MNGFKHSLCAEILIQIDMLALVAIFILLEARPRNNNERLVAK